MNNPKLFGGCLLFTVLLSYGVLANPPSSVVPVSSEMDEIWADSTLQHLTVSEKIGQLFVLVPTASASDASINQMVKKGQPGGLLLKNQSVSNYRQRMFGYRQTLRIAPFEFSDVSISINNQFSDRRHYPNSASFAAIERPYLKAKLWEKILDDFQRFGINANLLLDSNELSKATLDFFLKKIEALSKQKILSVAQLVPNVVDSTTEDAATLEAFIANGLTGLLLTDDLAPIDECEESMKGFYQRLLLDKYGFNGLLFGQLSEKQTLANLRQAGASNFLVSERELPLAIEQMKDWMLEGVISEAWLNERVKRILLVKKWLQLDTGRPVILANHTDYSTKETIAEQGLVRSLFEQSIVMANNPDSILPFKNTFTKRLKVVNVGEQGLYTFQNSFFNYANFSSHLYRPRVNGRINALAFNPIKNGAFIITLDHLELNDSLHQSFIESVQILNEGSDVVLINYGNPANLAKFDSTITAIQVFERNELTELLVPQLLFGAITAYGQLPYTVSGWLPQGKKTSTPIVRLKYTVPEEMGIASEKLTQIDTLFAQAIAAKATPGGQVLIAKKGKVIYHKTFGHHTYEGKQNVEKTDLYDVASITKTAATTLMAMDLFESKAIQLDQPIDDQLSLPKQAKIGSILLKNLFIHKSGLQRNMPIAPFLRKKSDRPYFCQERTTDHTLEIANSFFFNPTYLDSIYLEVSELQNVYRRRRYLYSDVNFYLIQQVLENQVKRPLDSYLKEHFYRPLGLRFLTYKPLERFPEDVIVPTQDDKHWRKDLVRGYVHDETAALLGGVGGNAGLFANANDLAVLFQMLLNGGTYGGNKFLEKETIDYFTASTHGNHRGLGFDKAPYSYAAAKSASKRTYGHTGFSGTCVWVDPDEELIYVFLSNRIHPNPRNGQLKKMRIRQKIHQVIYDALEAHPLETITVQTMGE
ncbi:MAG: serine hydrolase [Bacteroidota bacterium]